MFRAGITDNPLLPQGGDPVDKNNVSPRTSFAYDLLGDGRSVLRGGYGIFYDKTLLGSVDDILRSPTFADSFLVYFPQTADDPGPANGMLPMHPLLLNWRAGDECPANPGGPCPYVDRATIDAMFPAGSKQRAVSDVYLDSLNRKQPYMHQITFGFERELAPTLSVSADYIKSIGGDMLARINYNMPMRLGMARSDPLVYNDWSGLLGDGYVDDVRVMESVGRTDFDGLNLMMEKRYADRWGARLAYSFSYSRGDTFDQWEGIATQVGSDLNLDEFWQPSETDRRHIMSLSGNTELPGGVTMSAVMRYMSGTPLTIHDANIDLNQNGQLYDPSPPGPYSGSGRHAISVQNLGGFGGSRGPAFMQLDVRFAATARGRSPTTRWTCSSTSSTSPTTPTSTTRPGTSGTRTSST